MKVKNNLNFNSFIDKYKTTTKNLKKKIDQEK